jgi:hypothetical protein
MVQIIKSRRVRWEGMWHSWVRRVVRTRLWWGNPKEGARLEDVGVYGRMIRLTGIGWEDLDWIHLTEDRDNWRDLWNTIIFYSVQCRAFVD